MLEDISFNVAEKQEWASTVPWGTPDVTDVRKLIIFSRFIITTAVCQSENI